MKKTFSRTFFFLLTLTGLSCSKDIPECPGRMCVIAGRWILVEVFVDETRESSDLSEYNLLLNQPIPPTSTTSDFARIQPSGNSDAGVWSIENNGTILRLIPGNNTQLTEDWIIESFSPRRLILVINRDISFKQGPGSIRFVLEPA